MPNRQSNKQPDRIPTPVDPNRIPEPQPQNAKQAVALVRDDHQWEDKPLDLTTTDGIKRNIEAMWAAINRLASYIDGDKGPSGNGSTS